MADDQARDALAALSRFFVGSATLEETLDRVCSLATSALPAASFAGITMWDGDKVSTRVFTDPESPAIDQSQYDSGEGPCLDAFRFRKPYLIEDMETDDRYPAFRTACLAHDIISTLSLPLPIDGSAIGALNLYARTPRRFTQGDLEVGTTFADAGGAVVANAQAYWNAYKLSENLTQALSSRATIEQAKGILIAQSGVTPDEAFELLKRASQRENRPLREIAAEIVARGQRPAEGHGLMDQ